MGNACSSYDDVTNAGGSVYFGTSLFVIRKRESRLKGEFYPVGASVPFLLQDITLALASSKLSIANEDAVEVGDSIAAPAHHQALSIPIHIDRARAKEMIKQINFITATTKKVHLSMFSRLLSKEDGMNPTREELVYLLEHFLQQLPYPLIKPTLVAGLIDELKADANLSRDWAASAKSRPLPKPSTPAPSPISRDHLVEHWDLVFGSRGARAVGNLSISPAFAERVKLLVLCEKTLDSMVGPGGDAGRRGNGTPSTTPPRASARDGGRIGSFACFQWVMSTMDSVPGVFFPFEVCCMIVEAMSVVHANKDDLALVTAALLQIYCPQWIALHKRLVSSIEGVAHASSPRRRSSSVVDSPNSHLLRTAPPSPQQGNTATLPGGGTASAPGSNKTKEGGGAAVAIPPDDQHAHSVVGVSSIQQQSFGGTTANNSVQQTVASTVDRIPDESQHTLSAPQGPFMNSQNTSAIAKTSSDDEEDYNLSSNTMDTRGSTVERVEERNPPPNNSARKVLTAGDGPAVYSPVSTPRAGVERDSSADPQSRRQQPASTTPADPSVNATLASAISSFMGIEGRVVAAPGNEVGGAAQERQQTKGEGTRRRPAANAEADEGVDEREWPVGLRRTHSIHSEINDKLRDAQRAFMLCAASSDESSADVPPGAQPSGVSPRFADPHHPTVLDQQQAGGGGFVDEQKFRNMVALVELLQRDNHQLRSQLGGAMEDISDAFERLHSENVRLKTLVTNVNINQAFKERVQTVLTQMAESNLAVTEDITRTRHELKDLRDMVLTTVEEKESIHYEIKSAKREAADVHLKWVEVERRVLDASSRLVAVESRVQDSNQRAEAAASAVQACVMDHEILMKRLYSAGVSEAGYASTGQLGY